MLVYCLVATSILHFNRRLIRKKCGRLRLLSFHWRLLYLMLSAYYIFWVVQRISFETLYVFSWICLCHYSFSQYLIKTFSFIFQLDTSTKLLNSILNERNIFKWKICSPYLLNMIDIAWWMNEWTVKKWFIFIY